MMRWWDIPHCKKLGVFCSEKNVIWRHFCVTTVTVHIIFFPVRLSYHITYTFSCKIFHCILCKLFHMNLLILFIKFKVDMNRHQCPVISRKVLTLFIYLTVWTGLQSKTTSKLGSTEEIQRGRFLNDSVEFVTHTNTHTYIVQFSKIQSRCHL